MATCTNCGYPYKMPGQTCPSCNRLLPQNYPAGLLAFGLIVFLCLGFIAGSGFLLFMAHRSRGANRTNWWLTAALLMAIACAWSYQIIKVGFPRFAIFILVVNVIVGFISLALFFLRLKEKGFQLASLFKKNEN